jgi:hypothetical protein
MATYRSSWVSHGQDPCAAVLAERTNRLRAGFVKGTGKRGFVRGREATLRLVPSQLEGHLHIRVWG